MTKQTALELVDHIPRYDLEQARGFMVKSLHENGNWVEYKDISELRAAIVEMDERIREETRLGFQTLLDQKGAALVAMEKQKDPALLIQKDHPCFQNGHSMFSLYTLTNRDAGGSSTWGQHKCSRCGYIENWQYDF